MSNSTQTVNEDSNVIIDFNKFDLAMYSDMISFSDSCSDFEDDEDFVSDYDSDDDYLSDYERREQEKKIQALNKLNDELKSEIMATAVAKETLYKSVEGLKQLVAMSSK
ncbi:hypothetical protein LOD99_2510 [Oopsacas minuta]|uniref:Uncharacterized protein n=1 Tax=Oopsacas minuta TaxID=111878 RepID=A0AAV7K1V7_9METZ|nr:hypothetical protein LOD99_2510 [Oopsacas minuta]